MKKIRNRISVSVLAVVMAIATMFTSVPAFAAEVTDPELTLMELDEQGRIQYPGETVGFFKENGTDRFGMLSLDDGSKYVLDTETNTVEIYDVPSNNTVYDGIHWGFITDQELTKDLLCLESGNWAFSISADNCGYGIPVAPVKTEARGGGTTGSQYFLCIPTADKIPLKADYSAVEAALASVPEDLSAYTEESAAAVTAALAAVEAEDFYYSSTAEQADVDAAAKAITDAVSALEEIPAAETFGFTLQVGQYTEGADFHTASFDGVVYALKDQDGNEYAPSSVSSGMLTYSNLNAENTYTFTATKEGWTVVTQGDWDTDAHAYIYTYTGADEINVTITKADKDKNVSEYTHPGMIFRLPPHEDNVVDIALASVPEDLNYDLFTDETANALKDAITAADPNETDTDKLAAMAEAITSALKGLIPKDGSYEVDITKYNGTPYYLFEGLADNDKEHGKAVLVVKDGVMTADIVLKNKSYGQVCLGTKEEVIEAAKAAGSVPEGTIDLVLHDEKATYNGKEYNYTTGTIPVPALQTEIAYAYHSSNTTKYTYDTGWYDHGVMYLANSLVKIAPDGPEKINLTITNNTGMFKADTAYLESADGETQLVMALSGSGYQELFKGTYEQAVANGDNTDNWIHGYQNAEGKWEFRIPLEDGETYIPCVAISNSYYQKYLDGKNVLARAFFPRQFEVNAAEKTLVTGDYEFNQEIALTNNVKMFKVEDTVVLHTVGGPNSNNYKANLELLMGSDSFDKAFVGTADEAAAAETTLPITERVLSIPVKWVKTFGQPDTMETLIGKDFVVSFHSVDKDEWYERVFHLNEEEGTLTINDTKGLSDGTYKATKISTDVTTDASGMIMVMDATVVVKDGEATAVVTMKGTGADRLYVSDTATKDTIIQEAVAEEQKEVNGEFGNLLGGLVMEGSSAYTFWPVPIKLGEPKVYAARSASHFASQDREPEKYYYVHDFQIDEANLEKISDSTELPITEVQEAQRYLNQYFMDGKIAKPAAASSIKGKKDNVTVPYYDMNGDKLSNFVFKMAENGKFRTGWFIDKSILNSAHFSSSNLKKIRYPEGANGTVTFNPKATFRDEGMTFTATLKLYPADANYNQYDANEVYYDKDPLAEQTFNITLEAKPEPRNITVKVVDSVSKEEIEGASVKIMDAQGTEVIPAEGIYALPVPGSYTVTASAEGYLVPGTEDAEYVLSDYQPKKDGEVINITLIKAEDSKDAITLDLKDQMGDAVVNPSIKVYRWDDKTEVAAEADGSYLLYHGIRYGYTITAEGYEETTGSVIPAEDGTEEVLVNKYLSEQKFTFRVYDAITDETLEDVELVVKYGPSSEEESAYVEAQPDENGVYTIPIDNRVIAYGSKYGYFDDSLSVWSLGFDPLKECSFGLKPTADYTAVDAAIAKVPEDLTVYTTDSVQPLLDAVAAVERNLKPEEQDKVDAMAKAIEDALTGLEPAKVEPTGLKLNKTKISELATKKTYQLKAIFEPENATETDVTWKSSDESIATVDENGLVTALKYGNVTITATSKANSKLQATCKIQTRFFDALSTNVDSEKFEAIYWAADHKITGATESFGTNDSMTRGQFVRFLYRFAGSPKVSKTMIDKYGKQFKDVNKGYTHYKAIIWAVSKGLIAGYKDGTFKPEKTLSRTNVATILWKYAGSPKVSNAKKPFADVSKSGALAWGKNKKIFTGDKNNKFKPKANCLRGDFAVFLYRYNKQYKVIK